MWAALCALCAKARCCLLSMAWVSELLDRGLCCGRQDLLWLGGGVPGQCMGPSIQ